MNNPHHPPQLAALPLHLTLTMLPFFASSAALQLSKSTSSPLSACWERMPLPSASVPLAKAWAELVKNPVAAQAAQREAKDRIAGFLQGIERYRQVRFERDIAPPPAIARCGAATLLDYGGGSIHSPVIVLIPSLINRYYILDLTRKLSFARFLARKNMRVFVVDWGMPSEREQHYACADYITKTLATLAESARSQASGPLILGGYCMGGLLALALAGIRPDLADGLACFATPWDFTAPGFPRMVLNTQELQQLEDYISAGKTISADIIHMLFQYAHPYAFQAKLREFAGMDIAHPATQSFLAIEGWVNDGVPMAQGVARDCLIEWTQHNAPAEYAWRVGGKIMDPRTLTMPSFIAVPTGDRIVPAACALPLAKLLPAATCTQPQSGHVGMMVGSRRTSALWEPFADWIYSQFT